ncbi:MAG: DNA adenine methylase [Candidatus Paceibacterota bacterium]|jgi:DNA adenine methylase
MISKPFQWYGGKGNLVNWLMEYVPKHHGYLELFAGSAALLFAKWPSDVETLNDIDGGLVNFYRVLRDEAGHKELMRLLDLTPYAREEYYYCKAHWMEGKDDVEKAYRWYVVALTSFGGKWGKGYGFNPVDSVGGTAKAVNEARQEIAALPRLHKRIMRVQIECLDWRNALRNYAVDGDVCAYIDPPYIYKGIDSTSYVEHMKEEEHAELLEALCKSPAMVMLSGYESPLYDSLADKGWQKRIKRVVANVERLKDGAPRKERIEVLWTNRAHQKRMGGTLFDVEEKE